VDALEGCCPKKSHQDARTGHENGGEIVCCRLFLARVDFSEVLELVEEALDERALTVDRCIDRALHLAGALRGEVTASAVSRDQVKP